MLTSFPLTLDTLTLFPHLAEHQDNSLPSRSLWGNCSSALKLAIDLRGTYNTNDMGTRLKTPIRMATKHVLGYWTGSSCNTHDHICSIHCVLIFMGTAMHAPNGIPWICLMPRYSGQRGMTKNLSRAQPATACLKQLRHTRTFWKQTRRLATTIAPSLHLLANPTWIPDSKFRRICETFMGLGILILWRYWV